MSLYASWVHGNQVELERRGAVEATSKSTVEQAFDQNSNGDLVYFGGAGCAACLRIGWAARIVIFDCGRGNLRKSGYFWCHYGIPTPVIEAGNRAEADTVLINYECDNINAISISRVHVWDGNRRIFADDSPIVSSDDYNGGIAGNTADLNTVPNIGKLWRGDISRTPVYFGLGVSLCIKAQEARDNYLEIRGVGIDFQIE